MTTTNRALELQDVGGFAVGVVSWVDSMPPLFWQVALVVTLALFVPLILRGRRAAKRLGEHRGKHVSPAQGDDDNNDDDNNKARRDRQMLLGALIPAALFWLAVLIGSGRGLADFGEDTLGWKDGWQFLVPATLDGVAVTFAFLAFRALWKQRNPDRARRIVWASTGASAFLNFFHELTRENGEVLGAIYLGILSVMGMAILDEFLSQFEEGAGYIKREKPRFGLRWVTLPYPTLCAWLAWTNYPPILPEPGEDEPPLQITVQMAIEHLETVRKMKAAKRNERDALRSTMPAWTRVAPWVRARRYAALLDKATRSAAAQRSTLDAEHRSAMERLAADHRSVIDRITAEHRSALAERSADQESERSAIEQAATDQVERLERALREAGEQITQLQEERAREADQARALVGNQSDQVRELLQQHADQLAKVERQRGDLAVQLERITGELRAARSTADRDAQQARADLERLMREHEQRTADLIRREQESAATQISDLEIVKRNAERVATERGQQIEALQITVTELQSALAERSTDRAPARRSARSGSAATDRPADSDQADGSGATRSAKNAEEDLKYLVMLFEELAPPVGGDAWSQRAVNRITKAGFGPHGRAQRLIDAATEHAVRCDAEEHTRACIMPDREPVDALNEN